MLVLFWVISLVSKVNFATRAKKKNPELKILWLEETHFAFLTNTEKFTPRICYASRTMAIIFFKRGVSWTQRLPYFGIIISQDKLKGDSQLQLETILWNSFSSWLCRICNPTIVDSMQLVGYDNRGTADDNSRINVCCTPLCNRSLTGKRLLLFSYIVFVLRKLLFYWRSLCRRLFNRGYNLSRVPLNRVPSTKKFYHCMTFPLWYSSATVLSDFTNIKTSFLIEISTNFSLKLFSDKS